MKLIRDSLLNLMKYRSLKVTLKMLTFKVLLKNINRKENKTKEVKMAFSTIRGPLYRK